MSGQGLWTAWVFWTRLARLPVFFMNALVDTGIIVFLMVYVIMPRYTQLIKRWLYS
jgi:antibiotic biosynthesis monooxygenase (ABM) superfamily enzyme